MQTIIWSEQTPEQRREALSRPALKNSAELSYGVAQIIDAVSIQGDEALLDFTKKFDGLTVKTVKVSTGALQQAEVKINEAVKQAIQLAYNNIKKFHQAQAFKPVIVETSPGVTCELHSQPIEAVGLYVPGGTAPLPSTVLMLATTAKIAGCSRIVLCTPPSGVDEQGEPTVTTEILYAAKLCGVDEVYAIGGAQSIAAMALGTQTIDKVDKIFGPGNSFVTEAKQQVSQMIQGAAIDMPAGPSEVLVLADSKANPEFIAADLLSQAEHGKDSQVMLVCDSEQVLEATQQALNRQLAQLSRTDIAAAALENSRLILATDIQQAIDISNDYAPEHLIVQTENPRALLPQLRNAGSIFLGAYTPESAGDYASGTNHVLPTYGYTRAYSSLNLADFCTRFTVQQATKQGLGNIAQAICDLADAEGLDAHKNAVVVRMQEADL